GQPWPARALRGYRRLPLQANRRARGHPRSSLRAREGPGSHWSRESRGTCRRRTSVPRDADLCSRAMIGRAEGPRISITGLGSYVPARVLSNDELSTIVDTSDEWIMDRTGIRERRIAAPEEALTDLALPAARAALEQAQLEPKDIDLLVCATVTPDMMFPTASALLADELGAPTAAAYDLLAGCTGFVYALAQAYGMLASGLTRRVLVVGGDVLPKILDWSDRSTLVLFGDGAGAVVMEPVEEGGFLGFELGADGGGGEHLWLPGSGSRKFDDANGYVKMNGREVFKFA